MNRRILVVSGLILLTIFTLIPFYWMLITSLKTNLQMLLSKNVYFPSPFTFKNFLYLFDETRFPKWILNSFAVASLSTLISLTVGCLAGYSVSLLRWRGSGLSSLIIMVTYLVPPGLMFLPLYKEFVSHNFINSLSTLVVAYPTFITPFCAWLMIGFFKSIPRSLLEMALIDGANHIRIFLTIIMPLSAPGALAAGLFAFTLSWNEFLYALIFITTEDKQTLTVGLSGLLTADVAFWGSLFGASLMATLPVIILYIYVQKYMIAGLTMGAVKG